MIADLSLVLVLGLVVYRAVRVMTVDKISQPWREWLLIRVQHAGAETRSFARWAYTLLTCPFCLGIHCAFAVTALYVWLVLPAWIGWEYPFVSMAVAGAQALMTLVDHRLSD